MRFEQAIEFLAAFEREGVRYILIGSMALAAQGIVRATRDIDVMIASDQDNVERIKRALKMVFHDDAIEDIDPHDLSGLYPVIRYGPPEGAFVIDLIARLGETFSFEDLDWQEMNIEGVRVRVATPRTLYRMKRDTMRPQDRIDAEMLRSRFDVEGEA